MDMRGVDLSTYVFDYDLTFAVLLMSADGKIHNWYGNRTGESAASHLSMKSLTRVLNGAHLEIEAYRKSGVKRTPTKPRRIEEIPWWAQREKNGNPPDCYHCHMVAEGEGNSLHMQKKRMPTSEIWHWPDPGRIGIELDRDRQMLVTSVREGSPAAKAGILEGDRITHLGDQRIWTFGDAAAALEATPASGGELTAWIGRGTGEDAFGRTVKIELPKDWRVGAPRDVAWRAVKWSLDPRPGFGMGTLGADEKRKLGLPADEPAFRVGYVVTWGPHARTGKNAQAAGIKKGTIVLSIDGVSDFDDGQHFHAWFRITQTGGKKVPVEVWKAGKREKLSLRVLD